MKDELNAIRELEAKVEKTDMDLQELAEQLSEEDREKDFFNSEKEAFVPTELKKAIKTCFDRELLRLLMNADKLITLRKKQAKAVKDAMVALQKKTITVIEKLSDEQVKNLLKMKWIDPLIQDIHELPQKALTQFVTKIEAFGAKYKENLRDNENQLKATENELIGMMHELTGSEWDMKGLEEFEKIPVGFKVVVCFPRKKALYQLSAHSRVC